MHRHYKEHCSISPYLMFVMEGTVHLTKSTLGSKQCLTTLTAGSIFGAAPIIATSAPSFKHAAKELSKEITSAVTVGKTRILCLPKVHYDKVIHSGYKTVDKIWRIIQDRREAHDVLTSKYLNARKNFVDSVYNTKTKLDLNQRLAQSRKHGSYKFDNKNNFSLSPETRNVQYGDDRKNISVGSTYDSHHNTYDRSHNEINREDGLYQYRKLKRYGLERETRFAASKGGRNSDQAINGGKLPLLTDAARWHHDDNNTRDEKKSILNKFGKQVEKYKTKFEDPEWIRKEKSQGEILQALSPPTENLVEEKDIASLLNDTNSPVQYPITPERNRLSTPGMDLNWRESIAFDSSNFFTRSVPNLKSTNQDSFHRVKTPSSLSPGEAMFTTSIKTSASVSIGDLKPNNRSNRQSSSSYNNLISSPLRASTAIASPTNFKKNHQSSIVYRPSTTMSITNSYNINPFISKKTNGLSYKAPSLSKNIGYLNINNTLRKIKLKQQQTIRPLTPWNN